MDANKSLRRDDHVFYTRSIHTEVLCGPPQNFLVKQLHERLL
jgi:hypothetical protein